MSVVLKSTDSPIPSVENGDLFLCYSFASAINSTNLKAVFDKQPANEETTQEDQNSLIPSTSDSQQVLTDEPPSISAEENEKDKWNVGDQCLCPYSSDGLYYRGTIKDLSDTCLVYFDDYGNEELHDVNELVSFEDLNQLSPLSISSSIFQQPSIAIPPPLMTIPSHDNNDSDHLSSTLMSWYLAGYHTGYYVGLKAVTKK